MSEPARPTQCPFCGGALVPSRVLPAARCAECGQLVGYEPEDGTSDPPTVKVPVEEP